MFKILSYLYFDPFSECYRKILTLSSDPKDDNISNIIKNIPRKKRSPFDYPCNCELDPYCIYAFLNPNNTREFINIENIDILLTYLMSKKYEIDYQFTDLMIKNPNNIDKDLICYIKKLI